MRLKDMNMKLLKALSVFTLLAMAVPAFAQQNTLTQTTLAADANGATVASNGSPAPTTIQVTSATGISATAAYNGQTANYPTGSDIYVDRELMQVISVNGTVLTVVRGINGTVAASHRKGAMVLAGNPSWFYVNDPGGSGGFNGVVGDSCVLANVVATPRVNVRTGAQVICSSISLTYVPGFNNPLVPIASGVTAAVASAAGAVTPSGPLFHITGALAITGFNIPVGCSANTVATLGGCAFSVIPDGTFTWTSAGNIAIAGTAVVNKVITFIWDATNKKWVPNVLS